MRGVAEAVPAVLMVQTSSPVSIAQTRTLMSSEHATTYLRTGGGGECRVTYKHM